MKGRRLALLLAASALPVQAQQPTLESVQLSDPAALFTSISSIVPLGGGRVFVADNRERRITVLDASGGVVLRTGGEGEGPGEFRSLAGLWRLAPDSVVAWDPRSRRMTVYDADGILQRTFPVRAPEGSEQNLDILLGGLDDGRVAIGSLGGDPPGDDGLAPDRVSLELFDRDGAWLQTLGRDFGFLRYFGDGFGGPLPFSPFAWSGGAGDRVVFTNGFDPSFRVFHPTGRETEIPVEAPSISLDEAWATILPRLQGESVAKSMARRMPRDLGSVPYLGRVLVSAEGEVWVKFYDPVRDAIPLRIGRFPPGGTWSTYSLEGELRGSLGMPSNFAPVWVEGDLILGVRYSVLEEQSVEWMQIHR